MIPSTTTPLPAPGARSLDAVCLGHALVDRLAAGTPEVVAATGLELGVMTLVDAEAARSIEASHSAWEEVAGGSAANTAAGIASFGGRVRFVGSVGDDEAGRRYVADLEAAGVSCMLRPVDSQMPTGVCHVLVGSGGKRSMGTHLGAASDVAPETVEGASIEDASVLYIEGYLLDAQAAAALARAIEIAHGSGTPVSLSLSDPFVVERHRERVRRLVDDGSIDVLFCNEEEACSLTGTDDVEDAVEFLGSTGLLSIVTRGPEGCIACSSAGVLRAPAHPVEEVVDTTGAGDLFASGVLYGLVTGLEVEAAARLGSMAASEVISHLGARPKRALSSLVLSV